MYHPNLKKGPLYQRRKKGGIIAYQIFKRIAALNSDHGPVLGRLVHCLGFLILYILWVRKTKQKITPRRRNTPLMQPTSHMKRKNYVSLLTYEYKLMCKWQMALLLRSYNYSIANDLCLQPKANKMLQTFRSGKNRINLAKTTFLNVTKLSQLSIAEKIAFTVCCICKLVNT